MGFFWDVPELISVSAASQPRLKRRTEGEELELEKGFENIAAENGRLHGENGEAGNNQLTLLLESAPLFTLGGILAFPIGLDVFLDQVFAFSLTGLAHERVLEPVISDDLDLLRVTLGCLDCDFVSLRPYKLPNKLHVCSQ